MAYTTSNLTATGNTSTFYPRVLTTGTGVNVSISGAFVGTIALQRQLPGDSAATWRQVGSTYSAPTEFVQAEWENGVGYRLAVTAYTSGTATLRLGGGTA